MSASAPSIAVEVDACGFAARVHGSDLSRPLDAASLAAIRRAWRDHPVLCFVGQTLDPASLQAFGAQLGPFGDDPYVAPMAGYPHVIEVKREVGEKAPIFGSQWHSDWSFQATPPSATLLYGAEIPPQGGRYGLRLGLRRLRGAVADDAGSARPARRRP